MNKKERKQRDFENYKKARFLEDFAFFCSGFYSSRILHVAREGYIADYLRVCKFNEIKSVHTLHKFYTEVQKDKITLKYYSDRYKYQIYTLDEFREETLIEILAGL